MEHYGAYETYILMECNQCWKQYKFPYWAKNYKSTHHKFKNKKQVSKEALKLDSHLPKKNLFICFNDSPSKMMKNAFYFILKALFVLKIFKFFFLTFGHVEKTA